MIVETVRSALPPSLPRLLGLAVCSVFALGTGNNVVVMFAIALASASLLTTVGMIVPMDPFAPVTGRALGTTGIGSSPGSLVGPGGWGVASGPERCTRLSACRRHCDSSRAALDLGGAKRAAKPRWHMPAFFHRVPLDRKSTRL